jgi:hypothetical protein
MENAMPGSRTSRTHLLITLTLSMAVALAPSLALAFPEGSGDLNGTVKLRPEPNCLRGSAFGSATVRVDDKGRVSVDVAGKYLTGKSKKDNSKGTKLALKFDSRSRTLLENTIGAWAGDLCAGALKIENSSVRKAQLKLNKMRTDAKLKLRVEAKAKGNGKKVESRYALTVSGPWTVGSQP